MISIHDIEDARERIRSATYLSPCAHSLWFSERSGLEVHLKLENLQMTGSFKERGALNKLLALGDAERARGVVCASAGNHSQGLAYHARRLGIAVSVVMPETTPLIKVTNTRGHGAEVILHGSGYDAAYREARRRAAEHGLSFVHGFDDDAIIAGQGSIGLELLEQQPDLDAVLVPVGGGGLIAGIACAIKERRPGVTVIGVESARMPSARAALSAGHPVMVPQAPTLADGIAVCQLGERTLPLIQKYVDDVVAVEEEEIANAILHLLEREKTLVEGAGAVAAAAVIQRRTALPAGARTAIVVSGGNIDVNLVSKVIERGLVVDNRLVKLSVELPDRPGSLHALLATVSQARANVLHIAHDRAFGGATVGDTLVTLTLETRGPKHVAAIRTALSEAGYAHRSR